MSLIPIVDNTDTIIGYKERTLLTENDICRVSALWITNSQGDVLLAKRHRSKKRNPLCWGPAVAGTVEKDETYLQNIIRESEEELGIRDKDFLPGPKIKIVKPHIYFLQWFLLRQDIDIDSLNIQEDEVEEVRWISPENLKKEFAEHPHHFVPSFSLVIPLFPRNPHS